MQNRFYSESGYDRELRDFCTKNQVQYQSFWTLTANPHILESQSMQSIGKKYKLTAEQAFYAILMEEGIIPLIGTCSKQHMQ